MFPEHSGVDSHSKVRAVCRLPDDHLDRPSAGNPAVSPIERRIGDRRLCVPASRRVCPLRASVVKQEFFRLTKCLPTHTSLSSDARFTGASRGSSKARKRYVSRDFLIKRRGDYEPLSRQVAMISSSGSSSTEHRVSKKFSGLEKFCASISEVVSPSGDERPSLNVRLCDRS
jgi:hypothetical protein